MMTYVIQVNHVTAAIQKMNTSGLLIPQSYIGYTYFRLFWMYNRLCMFSICLPVTSFFLLFDIYHCLQLSAFLRKWNTWREEIFVNYNSKIWNSLECNFRIACFRINFACRILFAFHILRVKIYWFGLILKHVYAVFCVTHFWLFLDLVHFTFFRNAKYRIKEILF